MTAVESSNKILKWMREIVEEQALTKNTNSSIDRLERAEQIKTAKCDHCSAVNSMTPFCIGILIDFKEPSTNLSITTAWEKIILNHLSLLSLVLADVTFKVKSQTIRAHSAILVEKRKVFSAIFQQNLNGNNIYEIEDVSPSVFRQILLHL